MAENTNTERVLAIAEILKQRLSYVDGVLLWTNCRVKSLNGRPAGRKDACGYLRIHTYKGPMFAVHRLIYYMHHGWLPETVDHIDGDNSNNRIENLRAASRLENARNCKTPVTNTSGIKGVYWSKSCNKWTASIRVNKRLTHLGSFANKDDAIQARKIAEQTHYGEFAR